MREWWATPTESFEAGKDYLLPGSRERCPRIAPLQELRRWMNRGLIPLTGGRMTGFDAGRAVGAFSNRFLFYVPYVGR